MDYQIWDYGPNGILFLLNSHPDIAFTDRAVVIKLGIARSNSFEPMSARDLVERGITTSERIRHDAIHGDVSVISINPQKPAFTAYQNVVSTSQLFYWRSKDTILFSDALRHLVPLLEKPEMEPRALLLHLMFRSVSGELTHFKDVRKLLCGHEISVEAGEWHFQQVERLDDFRPEHPVSAVTTKAVSEFERQTEHLIAAYVEQANWTDKALCICLSGGVDSMLLGNLVQSVSPIDGKLQSTSAVMHVPSFDPEIEYSQYGSLLLGTEHQYVDVYPDDFPDLLVQSVYTLARPIAHEIEPCYMAMAQYHAQGDMGYIFSGSAGDSLLGLHESKRLLQIEKLFRIPKVRMSLRFFGNVLEPIWHDKAYGMREAADILDILQNPESSGFNTDHTNMEMVKKCFDIQEINREFQYGHDLKSHFTDTSSIVEGMHLRATISETHDEEIDFVQMFQSCGVYACTPYLDSDFVRFTMAFDPSVRFYTDGRTKWLPKMLVEQRIGYQVDQRPKTIGGFSPELFQWMKDGVLRDLVDNMERPGYVSVTDFDRLREQPDWFTWNILNLDLFKKRFLVAQD